MPTEELGLDSGVQPSGSRIYDVAASWIIHVGIGLLLISIAYLNIQGRLFNPLATSIGHHRWFAHVVHPATIGMLAMVALMGFRTIQWLRYRAYPCADMESAPSLTVIIPAYNEGPMVERSINSVATAHYPQDKLEIVVIDDGSRDDTWKYICRAARRCGKKIKTVRFSRNKGKRAALEAGFVAAHGSIIVTMDSDSVIAKDGLLAIVAPFNNPQVGAVAGRVAVYNKSQGLIPRMLHVRYTLSFDFLRAVQSTYNTVYCCPGALAAYRSTVVREVLADWSCQTFLGAPCTYGEDRAMTNYILRGGYDTVYQRSAVVHTITPWTYKKLCKMYLRWTRSYIREETRLAGIVWRRPLLPRIITIIDMIINNLRYPIGYLTGC